MNLLQTIEAEIISAREREAVDMRPGDTVRVHVKIVEGDKSRIQVFEGTVIRIKRGGPRTTFTVRKISGGVGVERVFPLYGPQVAGVTVVRRGRVRRAKLYYLRGRTGKAARIAEKTTTREASSS